jgi:hypothetical protein
MAQQGSVAGGLAENEVELARTVVTPALDQVNDIREYIRGQSVIALGLLALAATLALGWIALVATEAARRTAAGWPSSWGWPLIPVALSAAACGGVLFSGGTRSLQIIQLYRKAREDLPQAPEAFLRIAEEYLILADITRATRIRQRAVLLTVAWLLQLFGVLLGVVFFGQVST